MQYNHLAWHGLINLSAGSNFIYRGIAGSPLANRDLVASWGQGCIQHLRFAKGGDPETHGISSYGQDSIPFVGQLPKSSDL